MINLEAEQYVLGCYLVEGELFKQTKLTSSHFTDTKHVNLFIAMELVADTGTEIDITTVVAYINSKNPAKLQTIGSINYLSKLAGAIPTTASIDYYEEKVLESWKSRTAFKELDKAKRALEQGKDNALPALLTTLNQIEETGVISDFDIQEELVDIYNNLENQTGDITGVDTHYSMLNHYTGGLQATDLIIIAGRPSMGKTAFALNIANNNCKDDEVTAIFSLEMGKKQLLKRMISIESGISGNTMRKGFRAFTGQEHERYANATGMISNWNLFISEDTGITVQGIRSQLRKLQHQYPGKKILCMIDYLQLMNTFGAENRSQAIGEITRQLKLMAKELGVTMVVLSQLSRLVEQRADKRPIMSDIRESGNIEQDADLIIMLYRDDYYDPESEDKNTVEVILKKHRNGEIGTVNLTLIKEYGKFVERAKL